MQSVIRKVFITALYCAGLTGVSCAIASIATDAFAPSQTKPMKDKRPLNWAEPMMSTGVDNLHRVTPSLYRSAQITARDLPQLRALGIRKIVSFRSFHSDENLLSGTGIALQRIRINTWNIRDEDMINALRALHDVKRDGPVLIHCQHGADRTGLVSALYRVVYQGWGKPTAENELLNGGFGFHPVWGNIKRYLEQVDVERMKQQVGVEPLRG